ncbi:MAG: hypothetical protein WCG10_03790 [Chlamydiota bacterium]
MSALGAVGVIMPIVNPEATTAAVLQMMGDCKFYQECSAAIEKSIHVE